MLAKNDTNGDILILARPGDRGFVGAARFAFCQARQTALLSLSGGLFDAEEHPRGEQGRFTFKPMSAEHVASAKRAMRAGKLQVKHAESPIVSDASGEHINHHVTLESGQRVHPDELHRLRVEDGEVALHPDEGLSIDDRRIGAGPASRAVSFGDALRKIAMFAQKPDDPVTIVSRHGYSATRPRREWVAMADRAGSFAAWYDAEGREHTGRRVEVAEPSAIQAGDAESEQFFAPRVGGQRRIDFDKDALAALDREKDELLAKERAAEPPPITFAKPNPGVDIPETPMTTVAKPGSESISDEVPQGSAPAGASAPALVSHHIDIDKEDMFAHGQSRSRYPTMHRQISVKAMKGANAVWSHQGEPQFAVWRGAEKDAPDYAKKKAAEIVAATKAGYKFQNYKAGKYGTLWVLEKDGRVLTERGAEDLVRGVGQLEIAADLPSMQKRHHAVKALAAFVDALPESTRNDLGALVGAINRSPLAAHLTLSRNDNGQLMLVSKDGDWREYEPSNGMDAAGNWHRQIDSSLPRAIEKWRQLAQTEMPTEEGGWAIHDRAADAAAVKAVPPTGAVLTPEADYAANGIKAKAFKAWFGDWENDAASASKVVDAAGKPQETYGNTDHEGKPIVLYHGTNADFDEFTHEAWGKTDHGHLGKGFYFVNKADLATSYSTRHGGKPRIVAVYLNIKNPYITNHKYAPPRSIMPLDKWRPGFPNQGFIDNKAGAEAFTAHLKSLGYDGVCFQMGSVQEWVAFEPTQIKSVANRGTFDASTGNIMLSQGRVQFPMTPDRAVRLSATHAPKGGADVAGQHFDGGEFIPGKVMAQATPAERAEVGAGRDGGGAAGAKKAALADADAKYLEHVGDPEKVKFRNVHDIISGTKAEHKEGVADYIARHRPDLKHAVNESLEDLGLPKWKGAGAEPWEGGKPENYKVYQMPTSAIKADPERFQFKANVNKATGAGEELQEVAKFDPTFAGTVAVWKDPADNVVYVVNGHHRLDLAKRAGYPTLNVMFLDAKDAKDARSQGALLNIVEGRGTSVDAAKFMRDTGLGVEDFEKRGVSLKGHIARDGLTLTHLNQRLFDRVTTGRMPVEQALTIAEHLQDPDLQDLLVTKVLDPAEKAGKYISPRTLEECAIEMAETPKVKASETEAGGGLFGDIGDEDSVFLQKNELKGYVRGEMAKEFNAWHKVASAKLAEKVTASGKNVLDTEENAKLAEQAKQVKAVFDKLVNLRGPISGALNGLAVEFAKAKSRKAKDEIRKRAVGAVRDAVFQELGVGETDRGAEGPSVQESGEVPASGGQRTGAGAGDASGGAVESGRLTPEPENREYLQDRWWESQVKARHAAKTLADRLPEGKGKKWFDDVLSKHWTGDTSALVEDVVREIARQETPKLELPTPESAQTGEHVGSTRPAETAPAVGPTLALPPAPKKRRRTLMDAQAEAEERKKAASEWMQQFAKAPPKKVAMAQIWDESTHHRGQPENAGEFGAGGGKASAPTEERKESQGGVVEPLTGNRGSRVEPLKAPKPEEAGADVEIGAIAPPSNAMAKVMDVGKKVLLGALDMEHGAKEYVKRQVQRLPKALHVPVAGAVKLFYGTYVAAQHVADHVAQANGLDEKARNRLATVIAVADIVGMKVEMMAGGYLAHVTNLGAAAGLGASFVPLGSLGYLAFSAGSDVVHGRVTPSTSHTVIGAKNAVKALWAKKKAGGADGQGQADVPAQQAPKSAALAQTHDVSHQNRGQPENAGEFGPGGGHAAPKQSAPHPVQVGAPKARASKAEVVDNAGPASREALAALFPGADYDAAVQHVASAVGAPDDAKVFVFEDQDAPEGGPSVKVSIKHPAIKNAVRRIGVDEHGKRYIENIFLEVKEKGKGFGSDLFSSQVENARDHGFSYITTHAGGNPGDKGGLNGYYTWPMLGYDCSVDDIGLDDRSCAKKAAQIRAKFPDAKTVRDVVEAPEGREWWKANGAEFEGKFELGGDSRSYRAMQAYMAERAKRGSVRTETAT
jgi:hypothetical protein